MFVCLDLETTGFDPQKDRIIEIAACRFEPGKIHDIWESLINPGNVPISDTITAITGITAHDLKMAPSFMNILPTLKNFIGSVPIIGHNIAFDLGFLEANGAKLDNIPYDTYELARIFLPKETSYALEILAQKFAFRNQPRHRAKNDVLATIELFELLMKQIKNIPDKLRPAISHILQKSSWPYKNLFTLS